jgi:type I restriction enzyme S subunit
MSGRYKAYGEYKDSGVEWLGEIPEYWHINKMRYMFSFGKGLTITKENLMDEGIPCVNYGEVHSKFSFEVDPGKHFLKCVNSQYLITSPNSFLNKGDLVFADTSEDIEGSGNFTHLISDDALFAGYHTIIARPHESKNSRFYAYLFDCSQLRSQIKYSVKGVKVFSITQAILRAINIWLPSPEEQTQIAAFLDHETAKIDTLIDKQQQLIELLKEKRQAVISHAVTKGLDPDVPMKDSGVDWLGEVPEHWEQCSLSKLFDIKAGGDINLRLFSTLQSYDYPFPIYTNTNNEFAVYGYTCKANFLKNTITVTGRGDVGFAVFRDHDYDAIIRLLVLAPIKYIFCKFFTYFINEVINFKVESSAIGQLSTQQISPYKVVFPSFDEQHLIATFLDHETAKIDKLIDLQLQQIELLKERRTALISAAVTGKIDVRDWQVPVTQTESDEVMA